ncbi:MAG: RNB domain-containing ribonuclease [Planctomycetota bacterium]|jgi:ribonuclease R|nr:RNB domain-containing ribonuclease [Planctomycetota bacterium]
MNDSEKYRLELRALFKDPGYRPMRSKDMAYLLGIPKSEFRVFRGALEDLRTDGVVIRGRDSKWRAAGREKILAGVIDIAMAGNGFLLPDDPDEPDVYIPRDAMLDAFDGDRVSVRIVDPGSGRRVSGVVMEVLERARTRIVANMLDSGKAETEDPRNNFTFDIVFSPDAPVKTASQSAKSQRRRRNAARSGVVIPQSPGLSVGDAGGEAPPLPPAGMKALIEVLAWPNDPGGAKAQIIEILGPSGDPDTETAAILAENGAPGPFPDAVLIETRRLRRELSPEERKRRLDLTGEPCCTIDPEDARDFDDALGIRRDIDGFAVDVHIADVAHYVVPGSGIDAEARDRSTSIYLPERVIPMLPEELSNDVCSLRPDEERPVKTVRLKFDADGRRLGFTIHRSLIRSRKRFSYGEVMALASDPETAAAFPDRELLDCVVSLHALAMKLRARRLDAGSIELNLEEFRVVIDADGRAASMEKIENDSSHQMVEEFMLAANQAVAEWAVDNGLPVLHRQHPPPKEERIEELAEFLTASGYPFKPPFKRKKLMDVVAQVHDRPEEHAVNLMILKSFQQALYGPDPVIGHFALNFARYLHFTSPIRRYPDLHLHQMLDLAFSVGSDKAHKLPKKLRKAILPKENLEQLGAHASGRERRAMRIENEVKDFRRLELLSKTLIGKFDAVVTGVKKFGIFVEIRGFLVEGMIPRAELLRKGFSSREELPPRLAAKGGKSEHRRMAGDPGFYIGQVVKVRVRNVDLASRLCELEFLGVEI